MFVVKASNKNTPQPSPAYHSAISNLQRGSGNFAGTPERVSALRGACLTRDRHRCVITRRFNQATALDRFEVAGPSAQDDEGNPLSDERANLDKLEVAYILPQSLTQTSPDQSLVCFATLSQLLPFIMS